jgi:hypothetical protein
MKFNFLCALLKKVKCCTHENVYMPGVAKVAAASSLWKEKRDFNCGRLFAVAAAHSFNVRLPVGGVGVVLLLCAPVVSCDK